MFRSVHRVTIQCKKVLTRLFLYIVQPVGRLVHVFTISVITNILTYSRNVHFFPGAAAFGAYTFIIVDNGDDAHRLNFDVYNNTL